MKLIKRHSTKLYLALAVAGLAILYVWPSLVAANPLTAQQHLERAWKLANDIGVYTHRSEIVQTSHPTPRLENAGRSPSVDQMILSGFMNLPEREMQLTMEGLDSQQQTMQIKVEDGQSYSRHLASDEWTKLDETVDMFSTGGDPLGFLVAMENIQEVSETQPLVAEDATLDDWLTNPEAVYPASYTRYTFDINGRRYAQYIATQMEDTLRERGELPSGINLGLADQYLGMKAHGEIWLDEQGLPVHQVVHLEFPAARNAYDWYEAEITTTFQGWDITALENQLFWAIPRVIEDPAILAKDPGSLLPTVKAIDAEAMQVMGIVFGVSLLLAAFVLFVFTHRHSKKMHAGFALAITVSMLATPLLQSNQAYAFSRQQHSQLAEQEEQQAVQRTIETNQAKAAERDFDPTINPLAEVGPPPNPLPLGEGTTASPMEGTEGGLFIPQLQDTDDCTNRVSATDCDGDGLSDEIEVVKLGTDPDNVDTDGDRISDKVEVEGFNLNGQQWYLDPTNPDSNGDGVQDFLECLNLADVGVDGIWPITQLGSTCENTDGDTTPDVFDFDNDGDGVPDTLDASPNFADGVTSNAQSQIRLDLNNVTTNKTTFVDFQIRPKNPDNLWQNNNVFDWPENDKSGQITRVFTTTFADLSDSDNPNPKLGRGDVMLSPMLQIKVADPDVNTANPSGGLPVDATFSGDIATAVYTEWLDIDVMNDHVISISEDEVDGALYAYVPLAQVTDPVGDTPVAWAARMVYRPELTTWGQAHQVKLIWLVTVLQDRCDTSGMSNPDDLDARKTWCADYSNWVTEKSVIQTYYEDFHLTGLTVTEDHGSKTAVIAQTDALSVTPEKHLWQLATKLQSSFLVGDKKDSNTRFAIEEIKHRFDKDTTPYNTGDAKLWDIPNDKLIVKDGSAADLPTALSNLQTTVPDLLNTAYSGAAVGDVVNLLFAREDMLRSAILEETDLVTINGTAISVDLSTALLNTYANINWTPYQRGSAKWNAYDAIDYAIDELEPALQTDLTLNDLNTIVGGDEISNEAAARDGAILFLQIYYLTYYRGLADLVEIDGEIVGTDIVNDADFALNGQDPVVLVAADMVDLLAALIESEITLKVNGEVVANSNFEATQLRSFLLESASFGDALLGTIIAESGGTLVGAGVEWVAKKVYKKLNNFSKTTPTYGKWVKRGGTTLSVASVGLALGSEFLIKDENLKRTALLVATGATFGSEVFGTIGAYSKLENLARLKSLSTTKFGQVYKTAITKQMIAIKKVVAVGAVMGFVVETVVVFGFLIATHLLDGIELGSIQSNLLISESIGQFVVAVITAAISLTVVGAILVGIFAAIDAGIGLICELAGVDPNSDVRKWVCGGFSGAIALGVSYLIYDYFTPYDVNNEDRLEIEFGIGRLLKNTDTVGFVAGNALEISATISNTISLANPERVIIKTSYLKPGTTKLDRERLKDIGKTSTFVYSINGNPAPNAGDNLGLNGTSWQGDTARFDLNDQVVLSEGVNSYPRVYLNEAYSLATIECWGFIGADEKATCDETRQFNGANDTLIGNLFTYDVLPTTVNGFPNFILSAHPQLDVDGDGLLVRGSGLIDPDDTTWDTDADGLSDFWEMNTAGFNPETQDSDGDGLKDYWEALYRTRPDVQDTDGDGLTDGEEFFHSNALHPYQADNSTWSGGWTIVYDYNGNQSLQTGVSADPFETDSDQDTILDNLERVYGYHPALPSIKNVLTLDARATSSIYKPGSTIGYTATVKNELDNRVAYGLLEAEFPVDNLDDQQVINAIYPKVKAELTGQVTAPNVNTSTTQDLVVRAGALIETSAVNEVFVLPFDGTTTDTAFLDATSARKDFVCYDNLDNCPTTNGGTITFDGSDVISRGHDPEVDLPIFSISAWVKPTARGGEIYGDVGDFRIEQTNDGKVKVIVDNSRSLVSTAALTLNQWNYVVVTYNNGTVNIFVNSIRSATSTTMGSTTPQSSVTGIGYQFQGEMDRIALHNVELTKEDIFEVYGGLVAHVTLDDGVVQGNGSYCGFTDSISQREFACHPTAQRRHFLRNTNTANNEQFAPSPDIFTGVVGDSIHLKRTIGLEDADFPPPNVEYYDASTDNYLHFPHQLEMAGTTPGENDNAFSIAMWLHPSQRPYGYTGPNGGTQEALLTMPDRENAGEPYNNTPPMSARSGDGGQVRIWTTGQGRHLKAKVGGCTTAIAADFLFEPTDYSQTGVIFINPVNRWTHAVVAYDGSSTLSIYKNGQEVVSVPCSTSTSFETVDGFTIGYASLNNDWRHYPNTFAGWIDEFRIYNYGFTEADAEDLYQGTNVKFDFNGRTGQSFFENSSTNSVTGTCSGSNCPESGLPSIDNQGVRFDGNDYIELSENASEMGYGSGDFTAMAWVKGYGAIFGAEADGTNNGFLMGVIDSRPYMDFWGSDRTLYPGSSHDTSKWNHIAFRYQEVDENNNFIGEMAIYRNGGLVQTKTGVTLPANQGRTWIGRAYNGNGGSQTFIGMIDNVVIAEYALGEYEIRDYMEQAPRTSLHLDEGLENVVQNITSYSSDGYREVTATCSGDGCPVAGSRGQMREAPVFDGNDMLTINHTTLNLHLYSIGLWVKPTQEKNDYQPLIVKQDSNGDNRNYGLFIAPNSMNVHYSLQHENDCDTYVSADSTGELNKDQWNHVMMTFDGWESKVYINGTLQGTTAYTGAPCWNNNQPVKIGGEVNAYTGFEGSLDEIAIYFGALNAEAIKDLYDYQSSWFDTTVHQQIKIDAAAPQVDVGDSPMFLDQQTRMLSLVAYDGDSGLQSVSVEITDPQSGVSTQAATLSDEANSSAWFYNFAPDQSGRYTVKVTATDGAGYTTTQTKLIDVDNTSPRSTLTGSNYNGQNKELSLIGTVKDPSTPRSGLAHKTMTVDVKDRNGNSVSGSIAADITDKIGNIILPVPVWSTAYPFPVIPYGQFTVQANVADNVGNVFDNGLENGTILLDEIGPIADVVTDQYILDAGTTSIGGTASDIGYGLTEQQTVMHFEEISGATEFIDGSPGQILATCVNASCPTAGEAGRYGSAASFDGVDDILTLGTTPAISGTDAFAISAWIKTSHSGSNQVILQQRDTDPISNGQHQFMIISSGHAYWWSYGDDGFGWQIQSDQTVNDGQWHHVAVVREADGTGRLYIDGVLDEVKIGTPRNLLPTQTVYIGGDYPSNGQLFNGLLDEVTIYSGAPSADEIYYMANPLNSTITDVEVRFRSYDERDIGQDEGTWITASLPTSEQNFAKWSVSVPTLVAGELYKIDLKATDSQGNTRYIGDLWTGVYNSYDLELTAEADVSSVVPGDQITYTATYTNASLSAVDDATITMTVPTDTSFNTSLSHPAWSCVPDTKTDSVCTYSVGTLAVDESRTVTATLNVADKISIGAADVSNTMTIATANVEETLANNSETVITPLTGTTVDLVVTKTDNGGLQSSEGDINYTISISNTGNQAATVMITETVPNETYLNPFASWNCLPDRFAGSTCVYNAGVLTAGERIDVPFPVLIAGELDGDVDITNTVEVDSAEGNEVDPSDNTFSMTSAIKGTKFNVKFPTLTVKEGEVISNTGDAVCIGTCEPFIWLADGPGAVAEYDPWSNPPDTTWTWNYTATDGLETFDVVVEYALDGFPLEWGGGESSQFITFTLTVVNVAPTIAITGDNEVQVGNLYTLNLGDVVDPGDDTVTACTVNWGDGDSETCFSALNGGSIDHTYTTFEVSRTITVDLTDEDGTHLAAGAKVINLIQSTPPVLDPIADQTVTEGETVSFTATANDSDIPAQTLTFSLSDAPATASIESDGDFTWVTNEDDGPGVYNATIIVSDGTLTDSQTIEITVNEDPGAPVFDAVAIQQVNETETLNFTVSAVDPENDTLTYGLSNASTGMSIDSSTGEFSWTPTEAQGPAAYVVGLLVTDTTGLTDTMVAMVNVTEVNQAPVLEAIAAQTLPKTQPFSLTVVATDGDYPANGLSYTMINAPTGAALDESSGLFSWTPEDTQGPAEYTITFVVTDDGTPVLSDTQDVTFTVTNNPGVLITESDGSTDVAFGGYDTYEMVLIAQPTDTVTVTMSTDGQVETIPTRLVFTPDNWDEPQMVSTNAMDDVVYEGPHTGLISHSASSDDPGYDGIGIADVIVNIADDTEDLPVITIGDVTVDENVGTASVPVTLTGESVFATEVSFEVSNGTTLGSGVDYDATNGTLTWAANTNGVQNINITIVNDTDEEPAETINVALTDVMSGTIDDGNAVVTISANDEPVPEPLLSITKDVTTVNDPVKPGDVVTYTITVSNSGEGVAEDVTVQDTLPTYLSGTDLDQTVTISANEEIAFTVTGTIDSNVPVGLTTITNTASFSHSLSDGQATATIVVSKTVEPEPSDLLYLSARRNGSVDGLSYADEDILVYDPDADTWAKLFDGSDVGYRGADIDAFTILEDGSLLLSADRNRNLDGLGRVDDSDIVRFIPTSLGENTVGTFEWYFDASDVRLTRGGEDVDAISVTSEGKLLISTIGSFRVPGIGGRDEDLILFTPTSLGENTSGTWERYFDGSDVGLRSWREDVRGGQIDEATGDIYLTTDRRFDVPGLEGEGTDIFICTPTSLSVNTECEFSLYWAGEEYGFDRDIDAFTIGGEVAVEVTATTIALADIEEPDSPEEEDRAEDDEDNEDDTDEVHDLDDTSLGIEAGTTTLFLPIVIQQ